MRSHIEDTDRHADKISSLFIHIMPCATLHVMVHLLPRDFLDETFPAVSSIKFSPPDSPEHYSLGSMIIWATLPYALWQLSYHFLITVRKRSKIAAGRPTSFTWLRKSYRNNPLGKFVLSFPEALQEPVFMGIQYSYALLTMLPCPIWFWYRWASAGFMLVVFAWASWNGANYYIEVFGKRMEKELDQLRKEIARMAKSPEMNGQDGTSNLGSPVGSPSGMDGQMDGATGTGTGTSSALDLGPPAKSDEAHKRSKSVDEMPMIDGGTTAVRDDGGGGKGNRVSTGSSINESIDSTTSTEDEKDK